MPKKTSSKKKPVPKKTRASTAVAEPLKPLTPPDFNRCQAVKKVGAFTMGGRVGDSWRCEFLPCVVIRETEPGSDGRTGSMSLCAECLEVARNQVATPFAIEPINRPAL